MTLLSISQSAVAQIGLDNIPTQIVDSKLREPVRMLALSNRGGDELARRYEWRVLVTEHTFTTVDGTPTYDLPADFDRMVQRTQWDRTNVRPMAGQIPPSWWQSRTSGQLTAGDWRRAWRMTPSAGKRVFTIDPTPTSADDMVYEYVSNLWAQSSGGTGQTKYLADADTTLIPEYLIELSLIWRLLAAHGHPYAEQRAEFDEEVRRAVADDYMPPVVSMGAPRGVPYPNLPATGHGL